MTSKQEIEALLTRRSTTDDELRQLGPSDVPILIDIFLHDTSDWNDGKRRMALHFLGLVGNKQAAEFLIATAENTDEVGWLRTAAVRSLGYASHDKALAYLESTLNHEDYDFRKSAVMALSHSTDPKAHQLLEKAHADDDERIREHADKLLDDGREQNE